MTTTLTTKQIKNYGPRFYREDGCEYRITLHVRHDDRCGNGHNIFSITATIVRKSSNGRWTEHSCGCLHEEVAQHFPELAPLIKWHLCSTDGPMHYVANTLYHTSDRDHRGLRKGERQQLRNRKSGQLVWQIVLRADGVEVTTGVPSWVDSDDKPSDVLTADWEPVWIDGEGKARELDHARSTAIWPDATDDELMSPDLKERLEERLPRLMAEFQAAVESIGFTY